MRLHLQDHVGRSMAMHTRYPGHDGHRPQPGSPLGRVVDIINEVRPEAMLLRAPACSALFCSMHSLRHDPLWPVVLRACGAITQHVGEVVGLA